MRDAFSETLVELAIADPNVILLTGDHGYALFDRIRTERPGQFLNAGIAEQNMVGVAAGLARQGFRPFVYGLSAFVPIRVLEQIKLDVAHDALPIVFVGDGAGVVYSTLGSSHQSAEDIAALRAIPDVHILSPGDRHELRASMLEAYRRSEPVYLRMGKADLGDVHNGPVEFTPDGWFPIVEREGPGPLFIATGSMVTVAQRLSHRFSDASVWSAVDLRIEPGSSLRNAFEGASSVVTLEEHSIYGGLGGAVAEWLTEHRPLRLLRVGLTKGFSRRCGSYPSALREHGLDDDSVAAQVASFLSQNA
jgi:transketolase